jgi:hypothetical protein
LSFVRGAELILRQAQDDKPITIGEEKKGTGKFNTSFPAPITALPSA